MTRWYKRDGAAFVQGTMGLSLEEKGAYSLCLDLIYSNGGPIKDDARWLSGVCGVSIRKWTALRASLIERGKLHAENGYLMNPRAEKEIAALVVEHDFSVKNGSKGGRSRAETSAKPKYDGAENNVDQSENKDLQQATRLEEIREEEIRKEEVSPSLRAETPPAIPAPRPKPEKSQGTRWQDGAKVPFEWEEDARGACRDSGLDPPDFRIEIGKFERYWPAKAGAAGRKANWKMTFINWIIKAAEDAANRSKTGKKSGASTAHQRHLEGLAMLAGDENGRPEDIPRSGQLALAAPGHRRH